MCGTQIHLWKSIRFQLFHAYIIHENVPELCYCEEIKGQGMLHVFTVCV